MSSQPSLLGTILMQNPIKHMHGIGWGFVTIVLQIGSCIVWCHILFQVGSWIKSPVCKFINHTVSHLIFIALLTAATYRFDHIDLSGNKNSTDTNTCEGVNKLRPDNEIFTNVQICIIFWIVGMKFDEIFFKFENIFIVKQVHYGHRNKLQHIGIYQ